MKKRHLDVLGAIPVGLMISTQFPHGDAQLGLHKGRGHQGRPGLPLVAKDKGALVAHRAGDLQEVLGEHRVCRIPHWIVE